MLGSLAAQAILGFSEKSVAGCATFSGSQEQRRLCASASSHVMSCAS